MFSHELEVGVKCSSNRGCFASQALAPCVDVVGGLPRRGPSCPKAPVRAVPREAAALVLATQQFVANGGGGRHVAAGVLHRRGGRAALAVSVSVGWWRSNSQLSPPRRQTSEFSGGCGGLAPPARRLARPSQKRPPQAPELGPMAAKCTNRCKGGPRAANHADLSDCCLSIAEQQLGVVGLPAHALVVHSGSEAPHDRLAGGAGGFVIPLARGLSLRRGRLGHGHHILPAGPDRPKRSSVHDPGGIPVVSASLGWWIRLAV
jgi:hypothetical protein